MARDMQVSDSIDVNVSPEVAYALVSDVRQIPRWSPENTEDLLPEGVGRLQVGTTFIGNNRRGPARWSTGCVVIAADPGKRFAFEVRRYGFFGRPVLPVAVATWEYRFEPITGSDGQAAGTRITEIWIDDRTSWPDPLAAVFDRIVTGKPGFAAFQRENIRRSLAALKRELEK